MVHAAPRVMDTERARTNDNAPDNKFLRSRDNETIKMARYPIIATNIFFSTLIH